MENLQLYSSSNKLDVDIYRNVLGKSPIGKLHSRKVPLRNFPPMENSPPRKSAPGKSACRKVAT